MPIARTLSFGLVAASATLLTTLAVAQTVPSPLTVETVVTGPFGPTGMVILTPTDSLVLERDTGRVYRVLSGVVSTVLNLAVNAVNERGLLGIALDPDFQHNRYVYLYYTEATIDDGPPLGNRVYRYTWTGSALVTPVLVLDLPVTPGPNHNGGVILFGPDDRLYAVIGDLNHTGKLQNNPTGADPDDTSVILRVDRSGRGPIDNPFYDAANAQNPLNRYYAYGVRNSFGLTFDPVTDVLWDTENGAEDMDEINRVTPGFNSGWNPIMGPDALSSGDTSDLWVAPGSAYSDPEFTWIAPIAPAALAFVASRRMGCEHEHRLLVGNANCGTVQEFELDGARTNLAFSSPGLQDRVADNGNDECFGDQLELAFGTNFGVVTDIENGPDGFVYVLSLTFNAIYRIRPQTPVSGDVDGDLVPGACDCNDGNAGAWAPPREVRQLRVSEAATLQLGWDDQAGVAGSGTTYTVVSGQLQELRATAGYADACTLGTVTTRSTTDARPDPPPGNAYYYLVRAGNACSPGTYGDSGVVPDPRDLLDVSAPPPCS